MAPFTYMVDCTKCGEEVEDKLVEVEKDAEIKVRCKKCLRRDFHRLDVKELYERLEAVREVDSLVHGEIEFK